MARSVQESKIRCLPIWIRSPFAVIITSPGAIKLLSQNALNNRLFSQKIDKTVFLFIFWFDEGLTVEMSAFYNSLQQFIYLY